MINSIVDHQDMSIGDRRKAPVAGFAEQLEPKYFQRTEEWISVGKLGFSIKESDFTGRAERLERPSWLQRGYGWRRFYSANYELEAAERVLRIWTDPCIRPIQTSWELFHPETNFFDAATVEELSSRVVAHHLAAAKEAERATRKRFRDLLEVWRRDVAILSSLDRIVMHEAYQQIIGMGEKVLPLILEEFNKEIDHWPWALEAITGENPVPSTMRGRLKMVRVCWVEWGKARGLL
jgi:hypothetical protein